MEKAPSRRLSLLPAREDSANYNYGYAHVPWDFQMHRFCDRNIILHQTFEYRLPPPPKNLPANGTTVTQDLTSRYLGLVVVPGEYITKIEVQEFLSQMKGKDKLTLMQPQSHVGNGIKGGAPDTV